MNKLAPGEVFWNRSEVVQYFAQKQPDPLVLQRLARIPEPHTKVVLDLGCGTGRNGIAAATLGFAVHLCEPNRAMVQAAIGNIKSNSDRDRLAVRQHILYGEMTALPYQSHLFDAVIACGVLHQAPSLAEYDRATSELSRVSRDGSIVTLNVFTNIFVDSSLVAITGTPHSFITAEGLPMTLLPK